MAQRPTDNRPHAEEAWDKSRNERQKSQLLAAVVRSNIDQGTKKLLDDSTRLKQRSKTLTQKANELAGQARRRRKKK